MPLIKKFDGVNFSEQMVSELTPDLALLGQGFRCKRPEFQTFWKKGRILREVNAHTSRCWVVHCENCLAAYITLLADRLIATEKLLEEEDIKYTTFPAIKIGLLAADERASKVGKRMVEWALEYAAFTIAPLVGVRFMTVDAFYDKDNGYDISGFYQKIGFMFVNPDEQIPPIHSYRTMYFDLKPLIDLVTRLPN
ncbi:GNAT family N-acetyltransferase [Dyadobacter chenwenxiniae]|uniref:GNAT family N-acetyltransferase n=1 Tax=Dyadobacter chenwenxiniae TaxID=2906456 RepID=A0A9X1PRC4_9BACT|nr:GNAT family N-acetyltransferase [Dyadobacter chenwenxiniae]MCF0064263.1 GNAT family N-acetyltransferase [Dyadobacter chenwenxiniae]UON82524.1 GNAT family N-acetyltransferase [Dyadobacter chenwenxiniae]